MQKEDATGRALLRAAQSQDTISAAETQQRLQTVQLDLEAVGTKDGFSICGKPAPLTSARHARRRSGTAELISASARMTLEAITVPLADGGFLRDRAYVAEQWHEADDGLGGFER